MSGFTIGTATFTNGSDTVTQVSLSAGNTGYFASGTRVVVGADPVLKEVEAISAPSAGTFTLRKEWDLPSGTYSFLANMTSEGLRDAVQKIRSLTAEFSALTRLYDTVQQGLDATSSGEYFNVVGSGEVFATLYLNDNGSATLISEMPTADAVETSETNAANSAAAALVSEQNAAASEANALASEQAASTSETNAANSEANAANSEANAATSETNAANSEANAATSETNALASEQAAANSEANSKASEQAAANSETNAATSEQNASQSETNAAQSETNAAQSESAALQAQTATEQLFDQFGDQYLGSHPSDPTTDNDGDPLDEGDVYWNSTDNVLKFYTGTAWVAPEDVATTAANNALTSEQAAAQSEINAAQSETNAAQSETNAAQSETNAAQSETNAAQSETNAAQSAATAESAESGALASYNSFIERYYGPLADEPAQDPNGNVPTEGDLYFNIPANTLRLYNGTAWQNASTVIEGVYAVDEFTNIAGQTTITLTYDPGLVQVLYNGVQLRSTEFTATNGTSIVLGEAVDAADDMITVIRWGAVTESTFITETPTGSTGAKRTSDGRIKASEGVDSDDVLVGGQLSSLDSPVYIAGMEANTIRRTKPYQYTVMGAAFRSDDPNAPIQDAAGMWPHANVSYDADEDKFIIIYNINSGHDINSNRVLLRKKDPEGVFSSATVVADRISQGESMKSQSSGIAPNGDYLALIGVLSTSGGVIRTDIYRSSDKGATWTSTEMLINGNSVTAFNGDVTGFLVLSSGRIVSWYCENSTRISNIIYSDDNGVTWSRATINGSPTDITEPAWVELSDGVIVCMARASVVSGSTSEKIPAKFLKSEDGGLTWSAPVDSQSITNFTLANGEMIYHNDTRTIEFIHHSRHTEDDEYSSLFVSTATEHDAKNDAFSEQTRIGRLAAYIDIDDSSGDSGYVAAKKSSSGVINVFYYNGLRKNSQINWAIGRKTESNDREYFIDPVNGNNLSGGIYETLMFNGYADNHAINSPLINGFQSGNYTNSKRYGSYNLRLTGTGRTSATPMDGIDLTDVNTLFVSANALSMSTGVNFGIAVYGKETPTSVQDGRIRVFDKNFTGRDVIRLDVSDFVGVYYPMLMLSNSGTPGGGGNVYINQFGFTSDTIKNDDISETRLLHTIYHQGNTRDYVSGGWSESYMQGVGSVTFLPDHIEIIADGQSGTSVSMASNDSAINLTNKKLVEITVDLEITDDDAQSDAGIAVYSVNPPVSRTTDRMAFSYVKIQGLQKIYLDVRDVSGDAYINAVANANTGGSAPSTTIMKVIGVKIY